MTDNDAFIAGIREHPDDDSRRLVYADWLEEHDEPEKGEYLRIVHSLTTLPEEASERGLLVDRLLAICHGIDRDWREAVGRRFDMVLGGWWASAATKVGQFLSTVMRFGSGEGKEPSQKTLASLRLFTNRLREEAEALLKTIDPDGLIPQGKSIFGPKILPAPITPSEPETPASE